MNDSSCNSHWIALFQRANVPASACSRFFIVAAVLSLGVLLRAAERPAKPNILIMMADDMGLGDTSAYLGVRLGPGAPPIERTVRTPNLDSFARQGLLFTDAHAPASMCSSTRYSLLTGRYSHRSYLKQQGWLPHGPNPPMIQRELSTLPEMLQKNGYRTAAIGKYHVGMTFDDGYGEPADEFDYQDVDFTKALLDGPTHHGFDEFLGVPGNTEDPLDTEPRVFIRNDRWTFTNRTAMKLIGMKKRTGRILAAPDWDLAQIGPRYLAEAQGFLQRQSATTQPFFLYYVPNANHYQRNPSGDYAVPEHLAGVPIKGHSRFTDGEPGNDRADMVLENDAAFGHLLEQLRNLPDPRWPGHKLIENTLVIFTSDNGPNVGDNLGRNQESGGLRGKKAKIWEGGIRVPMLVYWNGRIEGGRINRQVCSLTDLYATLAKVVGHSLTPMEAQDSHDCLAWWTGEKEGKDERARVFFCHLGPPFLNDVLAIRKGSEKVLVDGGLALPSTAKGKRGASVPIAYYDLDSNLYEEGEEIAPADSHRALELAVELLEIHNRGHSRNLGLTEDPALIADDGWHNLRNDLNGAIGFEFRLRGNRVITHLGMWDDHTKDAPVRPARNVPTELDRDHPGIGGSRRGVIRSPHTLRLEEVNKRGGVTPITQLKMSSGSPGEWENEFRYLPLPAPLTLRKGKVYRLTMSTRAGDGDHFRDPAAFDGLSPLVHPAVEVVRGILIRDDRITSIPAFADMDEAYSAHRIPVGPTLRFKASPR